MNSIPLLSKKNKYYFYLFKPKKNNEYKKIPTLFFEYYIIPMPW